MQALALRDGSEYTVCLVEQKPAYEISESDRSSDVCSSDLR